MKILRELMRLQHERGHLDDATLKQLARELSVPLYRIQGLVSFYPAFRTTPPPRAVVHVCRDVVCRMSGGCSGVQRLEEATASLGEVEIREVSCLGRCDSAPAVAIDDRPLAPVTLEDKETICKQISKATPRCDEEETSAVRFRCNPYVDPQQHYGTIRALIDAGEDVRDVCVQTLTDSGLSGMGGAGFPTGRKWDFVAQEASDEKYVICNADESEPGTFKDREILRQLPHLVIEGMVLAGLSIGASKGIVYIRHEYGPECRRLQRALEEARNRNILGPDAVGSGRAFDIEIFVSPGGYILGEETALLEALEDKRGEPRNKPPYPGSYGLWGKPTLINNVETFALATAIVHHGAPWWQEQGAGSFAGLKFVSVSGDVSNPGVYEIPMGTTVSDVIQLAGGMRDGKLLKAFLPGGASSNFLTARHADTPLELESMKQAGSMLGTGAVIVIAQERNLFQLATNLVRFFRNESCGKCVPCRVGSEKAVQMLEAVESGNSAAKNLTVLPDLGDTMEQTSICGLGQVALNPILSMMQHFPDEIPR